MRKKKSKIEPLVVHTQVLRGDTVVLDFKHDIRSPLFWQSAIGNEIIVNEKEGLAGFHTFTNIVPLR